MEERHCSAPFIWRCATTMRIDYEVRRRRSVCVRDTTSILRGKKCSLLRWIEMAATSPTVSIFNNFLDKMFAADPGMRSVPVVIMPSRLCMFLRGIGLMMDRPFVSGAARRSRSGGCARRGGGAPMFSVRDCANLSFPSPLLPASSSAASAADMVSASFDLFGASAGTAEGDTMILKL